MTNLNIIVLAVLQGVTEFLPISSSGHLILVPELTNWPDQGILMDMAVHVGTLAAVVLYFWRDVLAMAQGTLHILGGRRTPAARLTFMVLIATIPVVIAGFLWSRYGLTEWGRSAAVIGWTTLIFGILLYVADRFSVTLRRVDHMTALDALIVGLMQCLSLVPGTSRSGITATAGRFLGFERSEATRFSMLLSIPATAGAGTLMLGSLMKADNVEVNSQAALMAGISFVTALVTLTLFMSWIRRATFTPFVIYRIFLGIGLLIFAYWSTVGPILEPLLDW
ncbi:undecaprenyl-diphosphate phosphatase [Phaeovibrio sulfidiphilus]|uniref:Undecaprenyl-diphosphatase n=1 Tax=Phaeovibrio sulfidiphilus TaxID=1220600 RepID=A0A8J6YMD3_9PROT|nr:undecaprenyl-diphosphate phosphatase [Phaeovibrio sulfidiphilus]